MICGILSSSFETQKKLSGFENYFFSNISEKITWSQLGSFLYGFYIHPSLPTRYNDIYFYSEEKEILILKSGHIYNSCEVRTTLGYQYIGEPELIFKAFNKWGPDFVKKLNGDFSIAIFQKKEESILLFRDHLGVQPLAYFQNRNSLVFSSDTLNLCRFFSKGTRINPDFLLSNLKYVDNQLTPNEHIKKLTPGHYLKFCNGNVKIKKYWFPESIKADTKLSYNEVIKDLNFLLNDSVKIRCNKKYTAGAHMSGGLDSSLVAVLSKKHYDNQKDFYGFSWASEKPEFKNLKIDERGFVKMVAAWGKIKPIFVNLNVGDYNKFTKNFFFNMGFFWEEKTRELAKKEKINLIFSGWGGDEFLSSGTSGVDFDLIKRFKWRLFFEKNPVSNPRKFLRTVLYGLIFPVLGFMGFNNKKGLNERVYHVKRKYKKNHSVELKNRFHFLSRKDVHLGFLKSYHIAERCEFWYIHGLKHGIEYRYPLIDKRIVEYVLKIPSEFLFKKSFSRILMRDLCSSYLPEEICFCKSKLDYALFTKHEEIINSLSQQFIVEIGDWKSNSDLDFIDFPLLEKDIALFKNNPRSKNFYYLFQSLYVFKKIHEFTKTYRSLPEQTLDEDNSENFLTP
jgi:asparagine synthase (glutamine-hydrolysing)